MKKILLLITVLSLTSCGLFRKTVKKSSSSEHIEKVESKSESKGQVKAVVEGESRLVSSEQKQIQKDIDESTTVTANEIEIKPDGSIKATGGVRLNQNRMDKGISHENKALERTDRYIGHIDATKENKEQQKEESKVEVKDTQVQSEPKGTSFIYFWVAIGLAVCMVIWFLRRK